MIESICYYTAFFIIVLIICVLLVIFAPKSNNFFKEYPEEIKNIAENKDIISELFMRFYKNGDIQLNDEFLLKGMPEIKDGVKLEWQTFPDDKIIEGDVKILPISLFSIINEENKRVFNVLCKNLTSARDVYFIKISPGACIKKHTGWADVCNSSLRFLYCFNAFCFSPDECGIWVNGEVKKISKDDFYIYDASKEHSIYNNTYDDIILLIIDFDRPEGVPRGFSNYTFE